jgi:LicD family
MLSRLWDFVVESLMVIAMPAFCSYHLLTTDLFLNVAAEDATGFEKAGNVLLVPFQYIFAGKEAVAGPEGSWTFKQKFDYTDGFWVKTGGSAVFAIPSLVLGAAVKGLGYLSRESRERHASLAAAKTCKKSDPDLDLYRQLGNPIHRSGAWFIPQGFQRRPGDEKLLQGAKNVLAAVADVLNEAKILWWADCGTCLGVFRYGGVIPWDDDIDIGILATDFENARRAFNRLDPAEFEVQDWSGRSFPDTFFKIFEKKSHAMFDVFCFKVDLDKREISSIFSLDESIFFPEWFKIRERPFCVPAAFDTVFPLKRAFFDGVEVFVPNKTKEYLQRLYGENLDPVKVYDPKTGQFEKDLTHPYWQRPYVH